MTPETLHRPDGNPLVVVEASRILGPWTRYEDQVVADIPDDVEVRFVGGPRDLADVDVIHSSGPLDSMMSIRPNATPLEKIEKTRRFVEQLRQHNVALVRTVTETLAAGPEGEHPETTRLLDDATTVFVALHDNARSPDPTRTVVIPYATLADRFAGYPVQTPVDGRVLVLTSPERDEILRQVLKTSFLARTPGLSVRVAGQIVPDLVGVLEAAIARTPDAISGRLELLSDAALIEEITAAEVVAVPAVANLDDLHRVMLALSFDRPVLVPASPVVESLVAATGPGWVVMATGPITAASLDAAMTAARDRSSAGPQLASRQIEATSRLYVEVFRSAAVKVREAYAARTHEAEVHA